MILVNQTIHLSCAGAEALILSETELTRAYTNKLPSDAENNFVKAGKRTLKF